MAKNEEEQRAIPNPILKAARLERGLTQKDLADKIGIAYAYTISRWENGTTLPGSYGVRCLCDFFEKTAEELGLLQETPSSITEPARRYWTVPYRSNPFFTGREDLLTRLHKLLTAPNPASKPVPPMLSGMAGIGKTQMAIEYAYRYRSVYRAIFWVQATSHQTLQADFVKLAHVLELPGCYLEDQQLVVETVKYWLSIHWRWLLILDNAFEPDLLPGFLLDRKTGHILLITRVQAPGSIVVEKINRDESALLLLRRAYLIPSRASLDQAAVRDVALARELATAMDGLPLALDQAGAYIEETGCGLATYLDLYRTDREKLLGRRGLRQLDHPESVAATWRQAFLNVEQSDPAAADLLRLCAFLAPDPIPETILTRGAPALGPALGPVVNSLAFNFTLDVVRRHSLLYRDPDTRTLTIHRLVQAVLKDNMDEQSQREWVERAVRAVGAAFPDLESEHWSRCREYLPHALACAALIEHYRLTFPEAAQLLTHAGVYLRIYAQFDQAEPLLQQALTICEHALEPGHPDIAASLNNLAVLYNDQGKYEQAKPLFQRSLAIFEKKLGPEHPYTIETRRAYADLLEKMQQAE